MSARANNCVSEKGRGSTSGDLFTCSYCFLVALIGTHFFLSETKSCRRCLHAHLSVGCAALYFSQIWHFWFSHFRNHHHFLRSHFLSILYNSSIFIISFWPLQLQMAVNPKAGLNKVSKSPPFLHFHPPGTSLGSQSIATIKQGTVVCPSVLTFLS